MMLRIEAGLPLVDVEWHNSRLAFTDHDRVTPEELGMGWMLRGVRDGDRAVRRRRRDPPRAGRRSPRAGPSVGIVVDWADWDRLHRDAGLLPAEGRAPAALRVDAARPADDGRRPQVGYVTSFIYSPVLQRHIGLARVRPDLAAAGHRGAPGARAQPPQHHRAGAHRAAPPVQPREEDGQAMSPDSPLTRTTPSSSAAATTGWSTPATSPRRGCAPWCWSSATSSAARRSPRSCCPGFSFTTFSYALSLLRPEIIHELDLVAARLHAADDAVVVPPDRRRRLPAARRRPRARTSRRSGATRRHDADAYDRYHHDLDRVVPGDPAALRQRRRPTSSARTPRTRPTWRGCSTTSAASSRR